MRTPPTGTRTQAETSAAVRVIRYCLSKQAHRTETSEQFDEFIVLTALGTRLRSASRAADRGQQHGWRGKRGRRHFHLRFALGAADKNPALVVTRLQGCSNDN